MLGLLNNQTEQFEDWPTLFQRQSDLLNDNITRLNDTFSTEQIEKLSRLKQKNVAKIPVNHGSPC